MASFLLGSSPKAVSPGPQADTSPAQRQLQQLVANVLTALFTGNPAIPGGGATAVPGAAPVAAPQPSPAPVAGAGGFPGGGGGDSGGGEGPTFPIRSQPAATVAPAAPAASSGVFPQIANILTGQPAFPSPTGGVYAAPVTPAQTSDINAIQGATQPGSLSSNVNAQAANALTQVLSGQPQDYSAYFKANIAAPFEDVFTNQTLPAIKAAFARSAGGTYSGSGAAGGGAGTTGYQGAVTTATKNLDQQLQQAQTALTTQAITNAANQQVAGINLAPGTAAAPINQAGAALTAATVPQQTQQTQLGGQVSQANTFMDALIRALGGAAGFSTTPTLMSPNIVGLPGQTGFLQGLLSSGAGAALAASDPRLKIIEGDSKETRLRKEALGKILKIKLAKARYIDDPDDSSRVMVMADDVQKYFPRAVTGTPGGSEFQLVRLGEMIPPMVAAIQALAKAA